MFENRAGRVLGTDGREVGTVFLEQEELRRRRVQRWWAVFGPWTAEPAIHQHYWSSDGSTYEDAIIHGEGLARSAEMWSASTVEVEGAVRPVRWCTPAESGEVRGWLMRRLHDERNP